MRTWPRCDNWRTVHVTEILQPVHCARHWDAAAGKQCTWSRCCRWPTARLTKMLRLRLWTRQRSTIDRKCTQASVVIGAWRPNRSGWRGLSADRKCTLSTDGAADRKWKCVDALIRRTDSLQRWGCSQLRHSWRRAELEPGHRRVFSNLNWTTTHQARSHVFEGEGDPILGLSIVEVCGCHPRKKKEKRTCDLVHNIASVA